MLLVKSAGIALMAIQLTMASLHVSAQQSSDENNPFLPPSKRIVKQADPEPAKQEVSCDAPGSSIEELNDMLKADSSNNPVASIPRDQKDYWTQEDVNQSKFLGEINGHRVYFNELKQVYFNIKSE